MKRYNSSCHADDGSQGRRRAEERIDLSDSRRFYQGSETISVWAINLAKDIGRAEAKADSKAEYR